MKDPNTNSDAQFVSCSLLKCYSEIFEITSSESLILKSMLSREISQFVHIEIALQLHLVMFQNNLKILK